MDFCIYGEIKCFDQWCPFGNVTVPVTPFWPRLVGSIGKLDCQRYAPHTMVCIGTAGSATLGIVSGATWHSPFGQLNVSEQEEYFMSDLPPTYAHL
jgi:hypothetical protein